MISILWVDDEIELLKPHIIYLEGKGYKITPVNSGNEALELLDKTLFQLVFLDENMPGLSGLETLSLIKKKKPNLPIVMKFWKFVLTASGNGGKIPAHRECGRATYLPNPI